jgi:DEAD/DEAH box helicase domain-containing protein
VRAHGDVLVRSQVVGFKKIKFFTNENVGSGKLELPENEMHTTAFWLTIGHSLLAELPFALSERQSGIFGLLYALGSMATLLLMCDRRDLGTAVGGASAQRSFRDQLGGLRGTAHIGHNGVLRTQPLSLRRVPRRDRI